MKQAIKIPAFLAVILIYSLAVIHVYGLLSVQADMLPVNTQKQAGEVSFALPETSGCFALPIRVSVTAEAGSSPAASNLKQFNNPASIVRSVERVLSKSFTKYVFDWLSFPIGLPKADIAFPFLCFW